MSALRKPRPLRPDSKIAVISPSNWVDHDTLIRAQDNAQTHYGLDIVLHDQCQLCFGNSGGTTADKLAAFHDVWQDPAIDAVFVARGGSRALHMLDGLNLQTLMRHPKIILGSSDTTVLLNTIYRKAAIPTFHGMHFHQFTPERPQDIIAPTLAFLRGETWDKPLFPTDHPYTILRDGEATAPLIGGNLSLIYAMTASGVDYAPRWSHRILMLEDIDEDLRLLDRAFGALRLAGVFKDLAGLVCGQFTGTTDTSTVPFGRTLTEIIAEHVLPDLNGPVILNAPFGHIPYNTPFPIGVVTHLQATDGFVALTLTESPFIT